MYVFVSVNYFCFTSRCSPPSFVACLPSGRCHSLVRSEQWRQLPANFLLIYMLQHKCASQQQLNHVPVAGYTINNSLQVTFLQFAHRKISRPCR